MLRVLQVTTTLAVVLFSIFVFGGGTLPLLRYLDINSQCDYAPLSATSPAEVPEEADPASPRSATGWFERLDADWLTPFFVRSKGDEIGSELGVELGENAKTSAELGNNSERMLGSPERQVEAAREVDGFDGLGPPALIHQKDGAGPSGAAALKERSSDTWCTAFEDAGIPPMQAHDSSILKSGALMGGPNPSANLNSNWDFELSSQPNPGALPASHGAAAVSADGLNSAFITEPATSNAQEIDAIMSSLEEALDSPTHTGGSPKGTSKSTQPNDVALGMQKEFVFGDFS
jgi:hypothetical protein